MLGPSGKPLRLLTVLLVTQVPKKLQALLTSKLLVIVMDISGSGGNQRYLSGLGDYAAGGTRLGYASATNSYNSATAAGSALNGYISSFNKVEVR